MFIGADPDQLDALASQMDSSAQTLDAIRGRVGSVLEQLLWQGADAHSFFEEWATRFSGLVGASSVALQDASRVLHVEAVQQREASGEGAGSSILEPIGIGSTIGGLLTTGVSELSKHAVVVKNGLEDLGLAAKDLDVAVPGFDLVAVGLNFATLDRQWNANPVSDDTKKAEVDTALSLGALGYDSAVAAMVLVTGAEAAPVLVAAGAAIGLLELGNDVTEHFDPGFDNSVVDVANASSRVFASGVRGAVSLLRHNPLSFVPSL